MKRTFVTEREAIYKVIILFYVTLNSAAGPGGKGSSQPASGQKKKSKRFPVESP
jgi:hypothetical protein